MTGLSKLLTCSCYELGHTWEPSCRKAIGEVALHGYKEAFKVYLPLYIVSMYHPTCHRTFSKIFET